LPCLHSAVCLALPCLRSLNLAAQLHGSHLALLAPLAPTLASLRIIVTPVATDPAALLSLQQLTNQRSLTPQGPGGSQLPGTQRAAALHQPLGPLPHLAHLDLPCWTPQFVSDLAPRVPHLTSISLGMLQARGAADAAWDCGTTAAVQHSLRRLRTLLSAAEASKRLGRQVATGLDASIAWLALCSRIKADHMRLARMGWEHAPQLGALARLPLASLAAFARGRGSPAQVEPLVCALQAQSQVTKVDLTHSAPRHNPHVLDRRLPDQQLGAPAGEWRLGPCSGHAPRPACASPPGIAPAAQQFQRGP
jgi:hypothetical protein